MDAPTPSVSTPVEWGEFAPGAMVASVFELRPGDLLLERTRKPGFLKPCHHVVEILGGDPSGSNRPLVRARMVDPLDPSRARAEAPRWIVLWDFYLSEGRTELFRAIRT
jgi:hypothetical protein